MINKIPSEQKYEEFTQQLREVADSIKTAVAKLQGFGLLPSGSNSDNRR